MTGRLVLYEHAIAGLVESEGSSDEVEKVANQILENAQRYCPVDTGALRDSGRVLYYGNQRNVRYVKFGGIGDVDYALFVELGTVHMAAQPYLRPAIDGVTA